MNLEKAAGILVWLRAELEHPIPDVERMLAKIDEALEYLEPDNNIPVAAAYICPNCNDIIPSNGMHIQEADGKCLMVFNIGEPEDD